MKTIRLTYWITTVVVSAMMVFSAYAYLTQAEMKQAFMHLGYPDYFRTELAIAKILGAAVLLVPLAPRVKEWAYTGFAITFVSAFIAHSVLGDPITARIMPLVFLLILVISYLAHHKLVTINKNS